MSDQHRMCANFESVARSIFSFLYDLGYVEIDSSPIFVRYGKDGIEVEIYYEPRSFEIGAHVSGFGLRHGMSMIIRASDPAAGKQYRDWAATTPESVVEGLERLALLMRRYGGRALSGEKEFFLELERKRKLWADEYALDVLVAQIRPSAEDAFRRGDYATAAKLYARIQARLSPAEKRKLAIAKEKST